MNIIKPLTAVLKYAARTLSDKSINNDKKQAQKSIYCAVGAELKKAKKKGKFVNGTILYNKKYKDKIESINQKKERRDKFIDEI